jgi:hypothetical protein
MFMVWENMEKYWKLLPAAVILLLYFGGISMRPLFAPDEFFNAAAAKLCGRGIAAAPDLSLFAPHAGHRLQAAALAVFGENTFALRFFSALATVLTGSVIYGFARRRSEALGRAAAAVYLGTLLVFAVGTSASTLPFAVLAQTLLIFGAAGVCFYAGRSRIAFAVLGLCGAAGWAFFYPLLFGSDFRRPELWGAAVFGLLPTIALAPVILSGLRHASRREPALLTAAAGCVAALAVGAVHPALGVLSALPFLAVAAAYGFVRYAEIDPEGRRINRALRLLMLLTAAALAVFSAIQLLARFEKLPLEYMVYQVRWAGVLMTAAFVIMLFWFLAALRERICRWKLYWFLLGFAFVMSAGQKCVPTGVLLREALESPLKRFVAGRLRPGTTIVADPVCAAAAVWTFAPETRVIVACDGLSDANEMEKIIGATTGGHVIVIGREGAVGQKSDFPHRKTVFKPAGLLILEYGL